MGGRGAFPGRKRAPTVNNVAPSLLSLGAALRAEEKLRPGRGGIWFPNALG